MTKEEIKNMMLATKQKLLYEDENNLEYENACVGEAISFEFKDGQLVSISS